MDENTPGQPQAGEPASINNPQPQAGNPEPQAGDGLNEHISLADAKKLRSEALNLRQRLKDSESLLAELKTFKEQAESAQLSDTEKRDKAAQQREKQLSELQSSLSARDMQLQEERNYNALERAGRAAGIADPTALDDMVAIALRAGELEHDENGKPTNATEIMKKLVASRPWLTGKTGMPAPTAGGATAPARSATSGPQTITKEYVAQVQKGGPQAWAALSQDEQIRISQFIRGGGLFKR